MEQEQFSIGHIIKKQRELEHITQGKLCEGVCDPSTLSKIESGTYHPAKSLAILLLQRLGMVTNQFYGLHRFEELEVEDLKLEIQNASMRSNYELAITLRDELDQKYGKLSVITQQFVLWMKADNGYLEDGVIVKYPIEEQFSMLLNAIRLTIPEFDLEKIEKHFLAVDEIKIILDIAIKYEETGKCRFGIEIAGQLIKYIKNQFLDVSDKSVVVPLIAYHCSRMLGNECRYEESLEVSQAGIDCCIEYCSPRFLGELLIMKSNALRHLKREEEAKDCGIRAYYILDTMKIAEQMEVAKNYLKEAFSFLPDSHSNR